MPPEPEPPEPRQAEPPPPDPVLSQPPTVESPTGEAPTGEAKPPKARRPRRPLGPKVDMIADAACAWRGLARLMGMVPGWAEGFDLTPRGFVCSFFAPLLAAPLYVFGVAMVERTMLGGPAPARILWGAALEHSVDAAGYPLLVAAVVYALRLRAGFAAFVTVINWASLFLNVALATASLLALAGRDGLSLFGLVELVLLFVSIWIVWRAARETLSQEFAPALLVVVLAVGWSAAATQVARWATGAG